MATTKPKPKTTDVIIPEKTIAEVTTTKDRLGERTTLKYQAEVQQNDVTEINDETENPDALGNNENDFSSYSQSDFEEIPKDKIDEFFDKIEESLNNENDPFYIRVMRQPDNFDDSFFYPIRDMVTLGVYGCRMTERYKISLLLQKVNNNSGGRFNLIALDSNQKPLLRLVGWQYERNQRVAQTAPIVARDVFVSNPQRDETPINGGNSDIKLILDTMREQHSQFMLAITNKPQQSQIETLLLTKAVDMITNPPQQNNNFEEKLLTIFAMPQMVDKMASRMFPAPPSIVTDKEPTAFDKGLQIFNTPMVQNALERVGGILEYVVEKKFEQNGLGQPQTNNQQTEQTAPEQLPQGEPIDNDMQILINEVIAELESENELTIENPIFVRLATDYGESFETVKVFCQMAEYQQVLSMLITRASKYNPFPFAPFIENNQWNERGMKLEARLRIVYEILKIGK